MKQWFKDFLYVIKPQNKDEIILRSLGVLALIIGFIVAKGYVILNTFGQVVWIFMVAAICCIGTCNRE